LSRKKPFLTFILRPWVANLPAKMMFP